MSEKKDTLNNIVDINILEEPTEDVFLYEWNENQEKYSIINSNPGIFKEILQLANGKHVEKNKEETKGNDDKRNKKEKISIRLVIHPVEEFLSGQGMSKPKISPFSQDTLKGADKLPIIHLSTTSIFVKSLYGTYPLPSLVPRLYQIMDSSIWNYLVPLVNITYPDFIKDDEEDFCISHKNGQVIKRGTAQWRVLFRKAILSIYNNYKRGLYNLEISHEYADINARLAGESYLSGAHASGVAPFIFHSESAIKRLIKKEFNEVINKYGEEIIPTTERIKQQNWRILLIDDKAKKELTPVNETYSLTTNNNELPWNCKLTIIKNVLQKQLKENDEFIIEHRAYGNLSVPLGLISDKHKKDDEKRKSNGLLIEYVETVEEAKDALKTNKYDLIMLDYLLESGNGRINYGYELLDEINSEYELSKKEKRKCLYKLGPHNRLFFIFISAYSTAVYERLLAEGLNRSEKYWHIAVGACPTNTPQLFLYNLLKLMEKQLEDSGIDKLSAKGIYNVVNKIYGESDKVRSKANEKYQDVLDLHYLYRKMLKDVEIPQDSIYNTKGSVLITDFITRNVNLGGLLEHLTQLVHLTAFGTVRQWPEMWEEYIYFKSQFDLNQFKKEQNSEELFYKLCENIETYILKLKSGIG